jgi:branched-chain amino acid transport system substrate-binding protein
MGLWSTRRSILLLVAALAIGVGACGGDDSSSKSTSDGSASKTTESKPLKIGASLPLTGDFSEPGKAAEQGYKVWQAMINEKGGLLGRKVELVIKDDASNQNTVVSDYNALISGDKVDKLLGLSLIHISEHTTLLSIA